MEWWCSGVLAGRGGRSEPGVCVRVLPSSTHNSYTAAVLARVMGFKSLILLGVGGADPPFGGDWAPLWAPLAIYRGGMCPPFSE